ncbi:alpha/beta-hydrolase [Meredithblackwellia eburnea MCA 4105]
MANVVRSIVRAVQGKSRLRPSNGTSSPHDREQQVPLNPFAVDDEEDDEEEGINEASTRGNGEYDRLPTTNAPRPRANTKAPKPPTASDSTRHLVVKRLAIGVFVVLFLRHIVIYLYSDPERWPEESWSEYFVGARKVDVRLIVPAAGKRFQGVVDEDGGNTVGWKGIRYAHPPTGKRRFRNPVPVEVVSLEDGEEGDLVMADKHDEGCPRPDTMQGGKGGIVGKEDCLSLNIHTPRKMKPGVKLPVMFWIHGGGFYAGSSSETRYNPTDLINRSLRMNQPFVFVSINYRLNLLGFSSSPPKPGPPPTPPHIPTHASEDLDLNVGLKDQIAALEWVRREIGNWGGDQDKVTLVGHSAGAISVGLHQLYSPPEYFRAAFMMSGAPTSFPIPFPHDAAARTIHPLPGPAHCPAPVAQKDGPPKNTALLTCLRQLRLDKLMASADGLFSRAPNNGYFPWYPVLEGEWEGSWLDFRPSDRIVRGTFSKVPVVMGAVRDEGTRFIDPKVETEEDVKNVLRGAFEFTFGAIEGILEPIWELYPPIPSVGSPYQTGNETFGLAPAFKRAASLLGDVFFQAPRRHFLRETPKDFGEPSWNYLYDEKRPGAEDRNGAQHGADLASWFGHPESEDVELHHLSRHMTAYLINFVAKMDPNGPGCATVASIRDGPAHTSSWET